MIGVVPKQPAYIPPIPATLIIEGVISQSIENDPVLNIFRNDTLHTLLAKRNNKGFFFLSDVSGQPVFNPALYGIEVAQTAIGVLIEAYTSDDWLGFSIRTNSLDSILDNTFFRITMKNPNL